MRQHAEIINSQPLEVERTLQLVQSTGQVGGLTPKAGGRLLDGRTWDEFPAVSEAVARGA
jgi:protein gp37